jgi:predicted metalloprotease
MNELNTFWGGRAEACGCQVPQCLGVIGAVFTFDPARIYFDRAQRDAWDRLYNTPLPSDSFMAHEYGHVVQQAARLPVIHTELQADCLAGFFLGSRVCGGTVTQNDVAVTFNNFCSTGGPPGSTWFNPASHGSCSERVSAVRLGMDGYLRGFLPGQACPL